MGKRLCDERCAEQCLVEEREQARRAATAEAIEARAAEERRLREAEFNAAEARLADAKAALERAKAAEERAAKGKYFNCYVACIGWLIIVVVAARAAEVESATVKSSQARESEALLASARCTEDKAFADRRSVEEAAYSRSLAWHGAYHGYPYGAAPKF